MTQMLRDVCRKEFPELPMTNEMAADYGASGGSAGISILGIAAQCSASDGNGESVLPLR
jgi:hypothetical protein